MKNFALLTISILSSNIFAMTLDCYTIDLATADIFGNIHIENFSPMDFSEEKTFEIDTPFVYSTFAFLYHPETTTMDLTIDSKSDIDHEEKSFATKLKFVKPKLKLGSTSVMSQDLNLDTLYNFCEINL